MTDRKLKILHTADLHLDSPFEGLSAPKAATRRAEQRTVLMRIAELANREQVDALLLCGDVLDSESPYSETGELLRDCLRTVNAPVFIAPGNHDYYCSVSPYARLDFSENVFIFTQSEIECFEIKERNLRVYGAAFTDRVSAPMLEGFRAEKKDGLTNIMCIHGEISNSPSKYNPISRRDVENSGLDYLALGHIHKESGLQRIGDTFWSHPGCPEGRGFDEAGEKTVSIIEIGNGECSLRKESVALRSYRKLEVDVSGLNPAIAVQMALPDETVRDVYRITLTGETDRQIDLRQLERYFREYFFELQIADETRLSQDIDIWSKAGDDTLRGIFLGKLKERYDNAETEKEKHDIEGAVRWGLAALDNMEEPVIHED